MAAMNMNQEQFEQAIREEKPVLVDFWAPWCGYCRRIGPAYEKIGEEYADSLAVGKINIDEEPQAGGGRGDQGHPNSGAVPERKGRGFHHRARLKGRDRPFHSGSLGEITEGSDMNNNHVYDMLVVGGGPGGYTAALYAARAGLDTIVLEKLSAGGQMALTEQIDNYPGFEDGIDGFSLAEKMQKQAERFGARSEYAEVLRMDLTAVPKLVETSEGIFRGKPWCWPPVRTPERWALPERRSWWAGAWPTAPPATDVLQGQNGGRGGRRKFRRGRCPPSQPRGEKVILVHRRDTLRATKIYHEPLAQAENVEFRWNSTVSALLSGDRLTGVRLRDTVTGEESVVDCDGVFVSVGRQPATALAAGQLSLDKGGYIGGRRDHGDQRSRRLRRGRCADKASPSGGHRRGGRRGGSPHGGGIYRGSVSDTKKEFKKLLRPAVFTLGGALAGLGYYALVGCSTGSCAITASPVNTMLYMGLMGWLLSGIFGSQKT